MRSDGVCRKQLGYVFLGHEETRLKSLGQAIRMRVPKLRSESCCSQVKFLAFPERP